MSLTGTCFVTALKWEEHVIWYCSTTALIIRFCRHGSRSIQMNSAFFSRVFCMGKCFVGANLIIAILHFLCISINAQHRLLIRYAHISTFLMTSRKLEEKEMLYNCENKSFESTYGHQNRPGRLVYHPKYYHTAPRFVRIFPKF